MKKSMRNTRGLLHSFILAASITTLLGCGGGDTSEFSDDDIPSPIVVVDDEGNIEDGDAGVDPVTEEEAALLPTVSAGNRQFADPNVLISLRGAAEAIEGATITRIVWDQVEGPEVEIPNPDRLENQLVIPDFQEDTELQFRLTAIDSEGRVNSSTTTVVVTPSPVVARVIGGVVTEGADTVSFKIRLSTPQDNDVSIDYTTIDGTAEAGTDYEATANTIIIPAGETEADVEITIFAGNIDTENESFILQITVLSDDETYSTNAGVVLIRDNPTIQPPPPALPELLDADPQTYTVGTSSSFTFVNEGAGNLLNCQETGESTLPNGLSISIDESGDTCEVSGTPTDAVAAGNYFISATNADGSDAATINIEVTSTLQPPALIDIIAPTFTQDVAIAAITLTNNGGGELTSCTDDQDALPTGLIVSVSENLSTCQITGTPSGIAEATSVTIFATNASGSSSANVTITVIDDLVAPALADLPAQTYTVDTAITPLRFTNNGGGELTECSEDGGEPILFGTGVSVSISEDLTTCEISGTPTTALNTSTIFVTASNASGNSTGSLSITIEPALAAPQLVDPAAVTYVEGVQISPLVITNSGGGELSACSDVEETLPAGLSVTTSEDLSTCEITGVPTTVIESSNTTVSATNASGTSSANVNITISAALTAPVLSNPEAQTYTEGEQISTLSFINAGGGQLTGCSDALEALPVGLALSISSDLTTCEITGTPTEPQEATTVRVTATNASGNSSASVVITVEAALEAPILVNPADQTYTEDLEITPLILVNNGGGELSDCAETGDEPQLPGTGLTLSIAGDLNTCEITGTPTIPLEISIDITATNAAGSGTASVNIAVEPALEVPVFSTPEPQIYTEGEEIPTLTLTNNGGGEITECVDTRETLPLGLGVSVSSDQATCEITGTPAGLQPASTVEISATNTAGTGSVTVSIAIVLAAPSLSDVPPQAYTVSEAITVLQLENIGGAELTECSSVTTLPVGLSVAISDDLITCEISGTPLEPQAAADYIVRATNASGSDDVTINITINDLVFTDPISLTFNAASTISIGLALNSGTARVDWNDGSEPADINNQDISLINNTVGTATQSYEGSVEGQITISFSQGISSLIGIANRGTPFVLDTELLEGATNLQILYFNSSNTSATNGSLAALAENHPQLEELLLAGNGNLAGDLSELPQSLRILTIGSTHQGEITGDLSDLSANITQLTVSNANTLTGLISEIPSNLTRLSLSGSNIVSGDIDDLHPDMLNLYVRGQNTIAGDIGLIENNGTVTIDVGGQNTITGDVADISSAITYILLLGNNTLFGDIENLHSDLTGFWSYGSNTISGDLGLFVANNTMSFLVAGQNTITGDLANVSPNLRYLLVQGNNTLFGNIQDLQAEPTTISITGQNFISGDIGLMTNDSLQSLTISGLNTIDQFTIPTSWVPTRLSTFSLSGGAPEQGFDSGTVDDLLNFFNDTLLSTTSSTANITMTRSGDAGPTSESAAAILGLEERGFRVNTNGLTPQLISFDTADAIFGFPGDTFERAITEEGQGSGEIIYSSSNGEAVTVDAETGVITLEAWGISTITATKAADEIYAAATASYEVNNIIGQQFFEPETSLSNEERFPLSQINDGITSDAFPFNGFSSTESTGTISLSFLLFEGESYSLDSFVLWNDINVLAEGVRTFRLDFFDIFGDQIETSFSTEYTSVSEIPAQEYVFPTTIFGVADVDIVVLSSTSGIEIREIGFTGFSEFDGDQEF